MSLIEDYLRDQARNDAAYLREYWYDHEGVEDWLEIERRHSIIDPSVPWLRYNPNYVGPTPYLDLLAHARRSTNISDYERYLSDFPNYPKNWTCAYCGGLRMASAHKCEGCGAART